MAGAASARVFGNLLSRSSLETGSKPLQFRCFAAKSSPKRPLTAATAVSNAVEYVEVPTEGISRPLSEILRELGKKVPESFVKSRVEDGQTIKYVPW